MKPEQYAFLKAMQELSLVQIDRYDPIAQNFSADREHCCARCSSDCDYHRMHLYGSREANRWGGKYIYYCPKGYIFLAISDHSVNSAGETVIAGPIIMGNLEDFDEGDEEMTKIAPNLSTVQARAMMDMIESYLGAGGEKTQDINRLVDQLYTGATTHDKKYSIELERELQAAIREGNAEFSRELLNKLIGNIFFCSNNDFETVRSRILELVVLLSRAAIDGGADPAKILELNKNCLKETARFKTVEELCYWMTDILNKFIEYVFEFSDLKHRDTLFKAMAYIKSNYMHRITLENVAKQVYMSKSYLSKIFKEELNCRFTDYVNQIRIEKSRILLEDPSLSLSEIANLTGFDDQGYFTKVFKTETGMAPGKYREKYIHY